MKEIKSAIDFLTRYKGCQYEIEPNECCHRECSECEYNFDVHTAQKYIETAIRSLNAWEEVLQELKEKKDVYKLVPISSTAMGKAYTYDKTIKHCNVDKTDVGNRSSGNWNSGDCNSGYCNSGDCNSGNRNSGDWNSGYCNSGNRNSGYCNSGNWNSGDWNSGNWNSGYCNSGYWNSGYWNSGNCNSGVFNTSKEPTIKMFDKESSWTIRDWNNSNAKSILDTCPYTYSNFVSESEMSDGEKEKHPEYKTIGGYVKVFVTTQKDKQEWWDNLSEKNKKECYKLPNFDADKFIKCLGIEHI